MPAPETPTTLPIDPPATIHGTRLVASPDALDAMAWPEHVIVLRFAPDDLFVIGGDTTTVGADHAIVAAESGYVGCWLNTGQLTRVAAHLEWSLPAQRPALAQGLIAGVPAKLYLTAGRGMGEQAALLLTNAPYAHDLWERLG